MNSETLRQSRSTYEREQENLNYAKYWQCWLTPEYIVLAHSRELVFSAFLFPHMVAFPRFCPHSRRFMRKHTYLLYNGFPLLTSQEATHVSTIFFVRTLVLDEVGEDAFSPVAITQASLSEHFGIAFQSVEMESYDTRVLECDCQPL